MTYQAEDIYVLEGLEPVRKRPAMYIGSTGPGGLHHLVFEAVDNSVDEALAGFCTFIEVELTSDGAVRVSDNGRGIPIETHPQTKKSALETVMTMLHAGGKFGSKSYRVSGGLHGVGISVVNALSLTMRAEVKRHGKLYIQEYKRGAPQGPVKEAGEAKGTGTTVIFIPDATIFDMVAFSAKTILTHLRRQAYLTPKVRIRVLDNRPEEARQPVYNFYFEGGAYTYLQTLSRGHEMDHGTPFFVSQVKEEMVVEAGFQYVSDSEGMQLSFANNIVTPQGGTHLTGFRAALTRVCNAYAQEHGFFGKEDERFSAEDQQEGLIALVSVKLSDPQFEGQTKEKLGNRSARGAVEAVVGEALTEFFKRHPEDASAIIRKILLVQKARKKAQAVKQTILRKGALSGLRLPGKLTDCFSRSPEESELFIVEGNSAGGCFDGDTKIALADGRNLSFKELVNEHQKGEDHYCYTMNQRGSVEIAKIIDPRLTKRNAEVVKVVLDNDEEIICTPDHLFMLADGTFQEAERLTKEDSLMPLYRQYSKIGGRITIEGYEMVFDPAKRHWIFTHLLADRYNLQGGVYIEDEGAYRHHKDFNKKNNNPDNLIRLSKEQHLTIHREMAHKTLHRPDVIEKMRILHKTPELRNKIRTAMLAPKMRRILSIRAKKQWENKEYKQYMVQRFLAFYHANSEYRERSLAVLGRAQKEYWNNEKNRKKQAQARTLYYKEHPEKRVALSLRATEQWQDVNLREWRSVTTKGQWTKEFRMKRLQAYFERNKLVYSATYYRKAVRALHEIYQKKGTVDVEEYERLRKETNDKSLLRYNSILERFFSGDAENLVTAVKHYNHRIKAVIQLNAKIDVFDLEVPGSHNFALASGVFVHNSAKMARDPKFQAILPLRGKILNVEKARLSKMLSSVEIQAIIIALGTAISEEFDLSRLRYHKTIIMADADSDGAHIETLLLTLFFRHFQPLIEKGYLYLAQPPLYRISKGKKVAHAFNDEERDEIMKTQFAGEQKVDIQRYKGLGEMNPQQLWETTMDPATRILKQVVIEDAVEADRMFDILLGDEVKTRRKFIQAHSRQVINLDI